MPGRRTPHAAVAPPLLLRLLVGLFHLALLLYLLLAPTVYGHLHRYAALAALFGVCQLLALWVVVSLLGFPLRYVRSATNLAIWLVLLMLLVHVAPLPAVGPIGQRADAFGPSVRQVLVNYGHVAARSAFRSVPVERFSLVPRAAVGVLVLGVSAAGLYWLVASAVIGRKALKRTTWAVGLGLALLAFWALTSVLAGPDGRAPGSASAAGLVPILGGDSLVPALLAALPLVAVLVLRPLAGLPRRPPRRRQSRFRWLSRRGIVWAGIALATAGLIGAALGASHVPPLLLLGAGALAVGFVLVGLTLAFKGGAERRRLVLAAAGLAAWVAAAAWLGSLARGPAQEASRAPVESLHGVFAVRDWFGCGAGAVSPAATFGRSGWPGEPGADADTSGYRVLLAEIGIVGFLLVGGMMAAAAVQFAAAVRRGRSPWTRLVPLAGLGAVASNALYFGFDASALLVPNLLALAAVLGIVTAWSVHGCQWRPQRRRLGEAHWPFVLGAIGIAGALGLAESDMLGGEALEPGDKLLHFGTFAAISLLVCYALGPRPTSHHLKTRILLAVLAAAALGVGIELAQLYLTAGRSFEWWDIIADVLGAGVVGLLWWVLQRGRLHAAAEEPSAA